MSDLISREAAIDAIDRERKKKHLFNTAEDGLLEARGVINTLPSAQPDIISRQHDEKFTDKEKRIFLAAMGRELDICKEVDQKYPTREAYEDTLESVCREIIRKVKGALWT